MQEGTYAEIFQGLSERSGVTGCATPEDSLESTCRVELEGSPRKSHLLMKTEDAA